MGEYCDRARTGALQTQTACGRQIGSGAASVINLDREMCRRLQTVDNAKLMHLVGKAGEGKKETDETIPHDPLLNGSIGSVHSHLVHPAVMKRD